MARPELGGEARGQQHKPPAGPAEQRALHPQRRHVRCFFPALRPSTASLISCSPMPVQNAGIVPYARPALRRPAVARRPHALSQAQRNGGTASGGRQRRACRCRGASHLRAAAAGGFGPHTTMLDEGTRALNLARGRAQPFPRGKCRRGLPSAAAKASLGHSRPPASRLACSVLSGLGCRQSRRVGGRLTRALCVQRSSECHVHSLLL